MAVMMNFHPSQHDILDDNKCWEVEREAKVRSFDPVTLSINGGRQEELVN